MELIEAMEKNKIIEAELIAKRRNMIIDTLSSARRLLKTELPVIDLIPVDKNNKEIDDNVRTQYEKLITNTTDLLEIIYAGEWLEGMYDTET